MLSTLSMRKAGSGSCAVIAGAGDGRLVQDCLPNYGRIVLLVMPGERPFENGPKHLFQFVMRGTQDVPEVISKAFGDHTKICALEDTDFYVGHPMQEGAKDGDRASIYVTFCQLLAQRPFTLGDDVIDGMQGAVHVAKSAHHLVGAPTPDELPRLSCPAIAIAPGPSLSSHLDALRALQNKCLLICADTALEGLLKAGITPHIVTPLERVQSVVDESFPSKHYPGVIFGGTPVVHHDIAEKFDRHLLIPGSDILFHWLGAKPEQCFFYGQSTGVLAVTLAAQLTTGTVHLVGHDLAFSDKASHWNAVHDGVQLDGSTQRIPVIGNNDAEVDSQYWWVIFLNELSELARVTGRVANVNAVTKVGARIGFALEQGLPNPDELPDFSLPAWPAPNTERQERFASLLRSLPIDAKRILVDLSSAQVREVDLGKLCHSQNKLMFGYVLRSILCQFGMQCVAGRSNEESTSDCADAVRVALRGLMPLFEQMSRAPICQEVECAA